MLFVMMPYTLLQPFSKMGLPVVTSQIVRFWRENPGSDPAAIHFREVQGPSHRPMGSVVTPLFT